MEIKKDQLFDAFGELLYALSMVDGQVQEAEAQKLAELLQGHEAAQEIQWSFDYEKRKGNSVEEAYAKALDICKYYGPSPEYTFLFDALLQVAAQSEGISEEERRLVLGFEGALKVHFLEQATQNFED